ncbi:MAG: M23 family metallopeptidase [Oscillospiraceae bacterium]|nr:M23 family metallopeptidase [Oscillospiraceae bacterium]
MVTTTYSSVNVVPIRYREQVINYAMPFEFLYVLLSITENTEYVRAMAELATEHTRIEFSILDSTSTHKEVVEDSEMIYRWEERVEPPANPHATATIGSHYGTPTEVNSVSTTEVVTNTLRGEVTYVRTWIVHRDNTPTFSPAVPSVDGPVEIEIDPTYLPPTIVSVTPVTEDDEEDSEILYFTRIVEQIRDISRTETITTSQATWIQGAGESTLDPYMFLGLWRNESGNYPCTINPDEPPRFVPDGRAVLFFDMNGRLRPASPRIVDAPYAFFTRLSQSSRAQAYENIMRYILYRYTGVSFGVTTPDGLLDIFNRRDFNSIGGESAFSQFLRIWEINRTEGEMRILAMQVRAELNNANPSITLSQQQIDALAIVKAEHGSIGNFIEAYRQHGNSNGLRAAFEVNGVNPFNISGDSLDARRSDAIWVLFNNERYIDQDGNTLVARGGGGWWWPVACGNCRQGDICTHEPATTSVISEHRSVGTRASHMGVDIGRSAGQPWPYVIAPKDGVVVNNARNFPPGRGGAGYWMAVDHGNGYVTSYMHLNGPGFYRPRNACCTRTSYSSDGELASDVVICILKCAEVVEVMLLEVLALEREMMKIQ